MRPSRPRSWTTGSRLDTTTSRSPGKASDTKTRRRSAVQAVPPPGSPASAPPATAIGLGWAVSGSSSKQAARSSTGRLHTPRARHAIGSRGETAGIGPEPMSDDDPLADGVEHDLGGVVQIQLLHQVRAVRLDGREAHVERGGDLLVAVPLGQQ